MGAEISGRREDNHRETWEVNATPRSRDSDSPSGSWLEQEKNDLKSAFLEVSVPMTPFHQRPWRKQNLLPIAILLSVCSAVWPCHFICCFLFSECMLPICYSNSCYNSWAMGLVFYGAELKRMHFNKNLSNTLMAWHWCICIEMNYTGLLDTTFNKWWGRLLQGCSLVRANRLF